VTSLRAARDALVADEAKRGREFGAALADLIDASLAPTIAAWEHNVPVALVAFGSYARRELCPGSDVDVVLLVGGKRRDQNDKRVRDLAERLWYPLWDGGFVTGHATRTIKQSLALAESEIDTLTAILDTRHIAGDPTLTEELERRGRELAVRRRDRVLQALADGAVARRAKPGPVAEMLEPDVKDGSGGLRDLQALEWAGHTFGGSGGVATLVERGFLTADDSARIDAALEHLLDVRVALHRATGGRDDRLLLQEQDAVATQLAFPDADELVRVLASRARDVAWIAREAWSRLDDFRAGPASRGAQQDRVLAEGVVLRDGRVALTVEGPLRALDVLEAAAAAADVDAPFERASLGRLREMQSPVWDVWERAAFLRLLRAGDPAIEVFEALDHEGVLTRLLPEWEHVRSLPQRNAYHRFTVDRHSLEAVAECARLLDAADADPLEFDGVVARACRRPDLLLLAALLHDMGKGYAGDHATIGADNATEMARRIGLDSEGREVLGWLVRDHLLLADTAMRRDLSDEAVADGVAAACAGDGERLRLLYLLTIGDSRATGPAAWGATKAALLRDLFVKAAAAIERGAVAALAEDRAAALAARIGADDATAFLSALPASYALMFDDETMARHRDLLADRSHAIDCRVDDDGRIVATVAAADRRGLLATLAGALTCCGLTVLEANLFSTADGMAIDVFHASDPYERVERHGAERVEMTLAGALSGEIDVAAGVEARARDYRRLDRPAGKVVVEVDRDASDRDTVFEVHTDDDVGLLYRLASTFVAFDLDVRVAKVQTLGDRVVDVFYVRDADGNKVGDDAVLEKVRRALVEAITARNRTLTA
jgi:[protein-PII] uridylyltransferase